MKKIVILLLCIASFCACKTQESSPEPQPTQPKTVTAVAPPTIIYKMKKDYSQNVPITLTSDGEAIASYPHPRDVYTRGELAKPTALAKGYWLDNRGINEHVAFLSYTYEEYAALANVPSFDDIKAHIIDRDPIKEMWVCEKHYHYDNLVDELNRMIKHKELQDNCKRIK